jgi:hypothetical protein
MFHIKDDKTILFDINRIFFNLKKEEQDKIFEEFYNLYIIKVNEEDETNIELIKKEFFKSFKNNGNTKIIKDKLRTFTFFIIEFKNNYFAIDKEFYIKNKILYELYSKTMN